MPDRILYSDDCLNVLNDDLAIPSGSVDLIYLDPPFNSKSIYNLPFAGKDKDTRPVEAFTDTWSWGTKEDGYLADLATGPQSRLLADIVSLAQRIDAQKSGGGGGGFPFQPTSSTWRYGFGRCTGYCRPKAPSTFTVTTLQAIT